MKPEKKEDVHPAPVLSLHLLVQRREKLNRIFMNYNGEDITGPRLEDLVSELNEAIRPKQPDDGALMAMTFDARPTIRETIRSLAAGRLMDKSLNMFLMVRIAGNYEQIRIGAPILHFSGQPYDQWVLVKILDSVWHVTKTKKVPGAMVKFRVLCGLAAGESFVQFFPEGFLDRLAREIGAKLSDKWRTIHYREVVGMFAGVLLEAGTELSIKKYKPLDSLRVRNASLASARGPTRVCPHNYDWSCLYCPVGHVSCPMGTHMLDYTKRACAGKPEHDGWFDPEDMDSRFCLLCQARRRRSSR